MLSGGHGHLIHVVVNERGKPPQHREPSPPGPATLEVHAEDDEARFDALFRTHYNPLRRYAYRYLQSWEEAEDTVHDVFVRLWVRRNERPLASLDDPSSYLSIAVRNRCLSRLDYLAHEARWRADETGHHAATPSEPASPERVLARRELAATLQRALDRLTERQRETVLLRWRGHSYEEIAAALGISAKTVSIHISRAFGALRELLAPLLSDPR